MRNDIILREKEIEQWIYEHQSKAFICSRLLCKPETLDRYLKLLNLPYGGNKGSKGKPSPHKKSVQEYLQSSCIKAHTLRLKLLKSGLKKHRCEICKHSVWNNKPIPLELDHIDGNRFNNTLNNLRVICPNCHAQTETHAGKNSGKYKVH